MSVIVMSVAAVILSAFTGIFYFRFLESLVVKPAKKSPRWVIGLKFAVVVGAVLCTVSAEVLDAGAHPGVISPWLLFGGPASWAGLADQQLRWAMERRCSCGLRLMRLGLARPSSSWPGRAV